MSLILCGVVLAWIVAGCLFARLRARPGDHLAEVPYLAACVVAPVLTVIYLAAAAWLGRFW